jgi:hypothetical protein
MIEYSIGADPAAAAAAASSMAFSQPRVTLCHTMAAKYVLGLTTLQMNKDHDYGGTLANRRHAGTWECSGRAARLLQSCRAG